MKRSSFPPPPPMDPSDVTYQQLKAKCGPELAGFTRCTEMHSIHSNSGDGMAMCAEVEEKLIQCAERSIPSLIEARDKCASVISAYNACSDQKSHQNCLEEFKKAVDCAKGISFD